MVGESGEFHMHYAKACLRKTKIKTKKDIQRA